MRQTRGKTGPANFPCSSFVFLHRLLEGLALSNCGDKMIYYDKMKRSNELSRSCIIEIVVELAQEYV